MFHERDRKNSIHVERSEVTEKLPEGVRSADLRPEAQHPQSPGGAVFSVLDRIHQNHRKTADLNVTSGTLNWA